MSRSQAVFVVLAMFLLAEATALSFRSKPKPAKAGVVKVTKGQVAWKKEACAFWATMRTLASTKKTKHPTDGDHDSIQDVVGGGDPDVTTADEIADDCPIIDNPDEAPGYCDSEWSPADHLEGGQLPGAPGTEAHEEMVNDMVVHECHVQMGVYDDDFEEDLEEEPEEIMEGEGEGGDALVQTKKRKATTKAGLFLSGQAKKRKARASSQPNWSKFALRRAQTAVAKDKAALLQEVKSAGQPKIGTKSGRGGRGRRNDAPPPQDDDGGDDDVVQSSDGMPEPEFGEGPPMVETEGGEVGFMDPCKCIADALSSSCYEASFNGQDDCDPVDPVECRGNFCGCVEMNFHECECAHGDKGAEDGCGDPEHHVCIVDHCFEGMGDELDSQDAEPGEFVPHNGGTVGSESMNEGGDGDGN